MLTFLFELIATIAYFFDGTAGAIIFGIGAAAVLLRTKEPFIKRIIKLLILSLPFSFIGIFGLEETQAFSWYNVFLVIFVLYCLFSRKVKISLGSVAVAVSSIALLSTSFIWTNDATKNMIEILQIIAMIIPVTFARGLRIKQKDLDEFFDLIKMTCLATAIGMIVQLLAYNYAQLQLGVILIHIRRTSYLGLFKGASILPIYMGIGFIVALLRAVNKRSIFSNILIMIVIFAAMILNTSRSAILALAIISAYIIFKNRKKYSKSVSRLLLIFLLPAIFITGIYYLNASRAGLSGFLDDNGRYETWESGLSIWSSNLKTILFGVGFSNDIWNDETIIPHNMVIQSLAQSGLIFTLFMAVIICRLIYRNRSDMYNSIVIYLILSGMLVTDFYANAFATVVLLLVNSSIIGSNTRLGSRSNSDE